VECHNPEGEAFGLDRLMAAWPRARQQPAQGILMMLLAAVKELPPMRDDMSLTLIRDEKTNSSDLNEHGK
jgi:serine phosphatase RsbU (regulator of sigma subunit)